MLLCDVLKVFSEEVNKAIEKVAYNSAPDQFNILVYVDCSESNWQTAEVWLFDNGETSLRIIDSSEGFGGGYVSDEMIDMYLKIRDQWFNAIAFS